MSLKLKDGVIVNKEQYEKEEKEQEVMAEKEKDAKPQEKPKGQPTSLKTVKVEGVEVQIPENARIIGATKYPDKLVFVWEDPTQSKKVTIPLK